MVEKTAVVINETGLHARPASEFVNCAKSFQSKIQIGRAGEDTVNAKSVILLLTRGFTKGDTVHIWAEGADEDDAATALAGIICSGFGEA